jgi:rhodanese-related sulfurtransferase
VPGAINISHDELEGRLEELEQVRDKDVVVYCRSGRRTGIALGVLERAGCKRTYHLEGDYLGWTAAGRAVEKPAS